MKEEEQITEQGIRSGGERGGGTIMEQGIRSGGERGGGTIMKQGKE